LQQQVEFGAPSRRVPDIFSARISSQPAAFKAASWMDKSCSRVLTRA